MADLDHANAFSADPDELAKMQEKILGFLK